MSQLFPGTLHKRIRPDPARLRSQLPSDLPGEYLVRPMIAATGPLMAMAGPNRAFRTLMA